MRDDGRGLFCASMAWHFGVCGGRAADSRGRYRVRSRRSWRGERARGVRVPRHGRCSGSVPCVLHVEGDRVSEEIIADEIPTTVAIIEGTGPVAGTQSGALFMREKQRGVGCARGAAKAEWRRRLASTPRRPGARDPASVGRRDRLCHRCVAGSVVPAGTCAPQRFVLNIVFESRAIGGAVWKGVGDQR